MPVFPVRHWLPRGICAMMAKEISARADEIRESKVRAREGECI